MLNSGPRCKQVFNQLILQSELAKAFDGVLSEHGRRALESDFLVAKRPKSTGLQKGAP